MNDERSANVIDRRLGQRLRARRLEIGLSQERLAEILGLTFQQVQKYEKGVNRIAASRLFEIANALEVPAQFFFDGLAASPSGVAEDGPDGLVFDTLSTPEGLQLMTLFGAIQSSRIRRRVVDLVRALSEEDATDEVVKEPPAKGPAKGA
jgi:transcriptional regulator with XRE-family HTH domain